jgi:hypothetical protein
MRRRCRTSWFSGVIALLGAFASFTSCALPVSPIRARQPRDPRMAYLYGRFALDTKDALGFLGDGALTFELRCRDGRIYNLAFREEKPFQIIELTPGLCQLEDIVFAGSDGSSGMPPPNTGLAGLAIFAAVEGDTRPRQMSSFRLLRNEELEPGGVYYVGDFAARARDNLSAPHRRNIWTLTIRDNYAKTTDEMSRAFPHFAKVRTEDRSWR